MEICRHTYAYWKDKKAICAVCGKGLDIDYDPRLNGVFPVEKAIKTITEIVANTCTIAPNTFWTLDTEGTIWRLDENGLPTP